MRPRALPALLACSLLPACIIAPDAVPIVDVRADLLTQYNHRGMPNVDAPVLQGEMALNLPGLGEDEYDLRAWGNMNLENDTGDAWFPDGHGGQFTESDLVGSYSRPLGEFDLTAGIFYYGIADGAEFATGPAFGPRGPTAEVFASLSREVLGCLPNLTIHYDFDEVEDFYIEGGVLKSLSLSERFGLDLAVNLGWSGADESLWNYGLDEAGFADLRGTAGLSYFLDDRTTLRALLAASTMVDSDLSDWFDVIGIDPENVWAGLGVTWTF